MKKWLLVVLGIFLSSSLSAAEIKSPTRKLNGTEITYQYTSGRSYNVKFEEAGVRYRFLTGSKPDAWWGPFPYKAFEVENNVYLASWFEEEYGDYVTLLINMNNNLLYGSAILSGENVHFYGAQILKTNRR